MASLQGTTVSGDVVTAPSVYHYGEGMTEWKNFYHCANAADTTECNPTYSCNYIHVRTPIPADIAAGGLTWQPNMIEVVGYHTYSGEHFHDWQAVTNLSSNNDWYGNQVRVNDSYNTNPPVVYKSTNTYGGYHRVCFVMTKYGCCCNGWFWVRIRNRAGANYRNHYAWATIGASSTSPWY